MTPSLHTLPIELVYRILDNLSDRQIFLSCLNVCARLNIIIDTYHRYQVIFDSIMKLYLHHLWNVSFISVVNIILNTSLLADLKGTDFSYDSIPNFLTSCLWKEFRRILIHIIKNFFNLWVYEILGNFEQSKHIFQRPCGYFHEIMSSSQPVWTGLYYMHSQKMMKGFRVLSLYNILYRF